MIKGLERRIAIPAIDERVCHKFGDQAGIRYYGEVTRCIPVKRSEITEIPRNTDEPYFRFEIKEWKELTKPIAPKEIGFTRMFTNLFLLEHSAEMPELFIRTEQEYRLYSELRRTLKDSEFSGEGAELSFKFDDSIVVFENGEIHVYRGGKLRAKYGVQEFSRSPNAVFRRIKKAMMQDGEGSKI